MIIFLMTSSGCSNRPVQPITETVYEKVYIPWEVLQIECGEAPPGETVRSLALSWTNNTGCLRAHQKVIEGLIRNYTEEGKLIYGNHNKSGR